VDKCNAYDVKACHPEWNEGSFSQPRKSIPALI